MNHEEKVIKVSKILIKILGASKKSGEELLFTCPFCHHYKPKLSINMGDKFGNWKCWVCNSRGKYLISLLKKLQASKSYIKELSEILKEEIPYIKNDNVEYNLSLPQEFISLANDSNDIEYKHAMHYLTKRNITLNDIIKYNLGYCKSGLYEGRIIIPSYDNDGKLNYFTARDYRNVSKLKYKNPKVSKNIIGFENQINWNYPIILSEGPFDSISLKRNAICLFGKTLPKKLKEKLLLPQVRDIYIALDNDALSDSVEICKFLLNEGKNVYLVQFDKKDAADTGFKESMKIVKHTTPTTFSDLMKLKIKTI